MEKAIRRSRAYKNIYRGIVILFVIICVVIGIFSFQYYNRLSVTIREESSGYLQEVSRRVGDSVDRVIADNFSALNLMAAPINSMEGKTLVDVSDQLKAQKQYWDYQSILLINDEGTAYNLNDSEVQLNLDDAMRSDILNKRQSMSTTQIINNQEFIVFSVPLDDVMLGSRKMVALAGTYDPAAFDRILSMESFSNQAYSQIVTKTGTAVTRPTSPYAMKTGYNVFSSLQNAQMDTYSDLDVMRQNIEKNEAGQIGFTYDGVYRYMIYTPLVVQEGWYVLTFVPVEVVNARSNALLQFTLFFCGLVTLAFAGLVIVLVYSFGKHKKSLEKMAFVDTVTGGNTIQRFFTLAGVTLDTRPETRYALIFTNLEKFKVLNEQLGPHRCDLILKHFYDFVTDHLADGECMGRLSGDNFCVLVEYRDEQELLTRFELWKNDSECFVVQENQWMQSLPTVEFGIYVVEDRMLSFPQMIDRAKLSLRTSAKLTESKIRYAFYDDEVRRRLYREKQLEDMMENALKNGEFVIYLQPKYHLPEEQIEGAEALARWKSQTEGMVFPDEFIPLFEKNGFIVQLDRWVFEETCRTLRSWMDRGIPPIKISVNCSRVNLQDMSFLGRYVQIADQYRVDHKYLEIELTESILMENTAQLSKVVAKIRDAGFGCSMDDFGSGYSSLNLIQSIPVDSLKLDRTFFHSMTADGERTEAVVSSIVQIAKALHMQIIAEGVEHREQVDMLKRVLCDYIQGYYYARPMEVADFEALLMKDKSPKEERNAEE